MPSIIGGIYLPNNNFFMIRISESEKVFLNDMSFVERSIFFYKYFLLMTNVEIACCLNLRKAYVKKTVKQIKSQKKYLPLKEKILESVNISVITNNDTY